MPPINLDTFSTIFTKKFMIWLISRVRHCLTLTLRSPVDKRGFFYSSNHFIEFFNSYSAYHALECSTILYSTPSFLNSPIAYHQWSTVTTLTVSLILTVSPSSKRCVPYPIFANLFYYKIQTISLIFEQVSVLMLKVN